jgi:hypothetical protein
MARVSLAHFVGKLGARKRKTAQNSINNRLAQVLWFSFSKSMARFTGFFGLH